MRAWLEVCGVVSLALAPAWVSAPPAGAAVPPTTQSPSSPADWTEQVADGLRHAEYGFSRTTDGSLSAPNRAHGLRTRLDGSIVEISSRLRGEEGSAGGWHLKISLRAYGRAGALQDLSDAGSPSLIAADRVELRRRALTEWYVNDERG